MDYGLIMEEGEPKNAILENGEKLLKSHRILLFSQDCVQIGHSFFHDDREDVAGLLLVSLVVQKYIMASHKRHFHRITENPAKFGFSIDMRNIFKISPVKFLQSEFFILFVDDFVNRPGRALKYDFMVIVLV